MCHLDKKLMLDEVGKPFPSKLVDFTKRHKRMRHQALLPDQTITLISKMIMHSATDGTNQNNQQQKKISYDDLEDLINHKEEKQELFKQIMAISSLRYEKDLLFQNKISLFCSHISATFSSHPEYTLSLLGKLLYLIDNHSNELVSTFNENNSNLFKGIGNLFALKIDNIKKNIKKTQTKFYNNNLQNSDQATANLISLNLAELLWTSSGDLNIAMIPKLCAHFFPIDGISKLHEAQILYVFESLKKDNTLLTALNNLQRENYNEPFQIDQVIRTRLGLLAETAITPLHLKKTALDALLSHARQDQAGSCFATFLPISLMTSDLNRVFKDLESLLTKDCLESTSSKQVITQVPYSMIIASSETEKKIFIDSKGHYFDHDSDFGSFALHPSWMAVCRSLNIKNSSEALEKTLKKIGFNQVNEKKKIIVNDLILGLCESIKSPHSVEELMELTKFCYKAVTHPPLLVCWTNAIANLCETQANSYLKTILMQTLVPSLLEKFDAHLNVATLENKSAFQLVTQSLSSSFFKSLRLIYYPDAKGSERSVEGGFVLELKTQKTWKRIENKMDFIEVAFNLLDQLKTKVRVSSLLADTQSDVLQGLEKIKQNLDSEWTFNTIARFKNRLHDLQGQDPSIESSFPWSILTGHDADHVLKLYFGKIPHKIEFLPSDAENALKKILSFPSYQIANNPPFQPPFRIRGFHACTWLPSALNSFSTIKDEKTLDSWIQKNIKMKGESISSSHYPAEMKEHLLTICEPHIAENKKAIWRLKINFLDKKLSIYNFRNEFIKETLPFINKTKTKKFEFFVDSALVEKLPTNLKEKWLSSIIPFADTNWHAGSKDLYFCFTYNLGTKNIEVWQMKEDKTGLHPFNTDKMFHRVWEIYDPLLPLF